MPSDAATETRPLEMLALSELNRSTDPPALTVSSSVAKLIVDEDCADTRLATRA